MKNKRVKLKAVFHSKSGKDVAEGFYYELKDGEAVPSNPDQGIHNHLALYGYPIRTAYGIDRVFPSDGDIFVRNLSTEYRSGSLWVELEEEEY